MGMIYSDGKALFVATDKRKNVYSELTENPSVELASYNLNTRKWIRISGRMELECSGKIREEMLALYPMITQEYVGQDEISFISQFIGYVLYQYWHFRKYPGYYAMQSVPWYAGILARGLFTLVILAVCMIIKVIFMEKIGLIKKIALILGIIFLVLTFIGGGYVLINHGRYWWNNWFFD